jgi:transcriptional regulator with XRE-family HTH domain
MPSDRRLARRLRTLREAGLAGQSITQRQLAQAFNASGPLISSWENNTAAPPLSRLEAYATFFATGRSVDRQPYRLLPTSELTPDELERRDKLLTELTRLWRVGMHGTASAAGSIWHFSPTHDITIICPELPKDLWRHLPYADPQSPDYVKLYQFADLDALIEIYGQIKALNPTNKVNISKPSEAGADLFTAHLLILGGVDFNAVTRQLLPLIRIPVRQVAREDVTDAGGFQVDDDDAPTTFSPVLHRNELLEDVAHFYYGPNPLNEERTVTICVGMYARGTLGAVRAMTDPRFRDRNAEYAKEHLGLGQFSILSRVRILTGEVVTPDWTQPDVRLHQWPRESREQSGVHQE